MRRPRTVPGWTAAALGAWLVLSGVAHLVGVLGVAFSEMKAYDFRYYSLLTIGEVLVFAGILQLWAAWRIPERWAWWLSLASAVFVAINVLLVLPVLPSLGMLAANVGHLAVLLWERSRPGPRRGAAD